MKKYFFWLILPLLFTGCANEEQKAVVLEFWKAKLSAFLPQQPTVQPAELEPTQPLQQPEPVKEEKLGEFPPDAKPENAPKQEVQKSAKRQVVSHQYMEIVMEEEPAKIAKKNTRVSAKDRVFIQRALENVRQANQSALRDIGQIFGPETQAQAFGIVAQSENILQTSAQTAESAQKYLTVQRTVLRQQEQLLNRLMQSNARNLRAVRG